MSATPLQIVPGHESKNKIAPEGARQSPVDICSTGCEDLPSEKNPRSTLAIKVHAVKGLVSFNNSTRNVSVKVGSGNSAVCNGKRFQLKELHFHAPSEHTLDGVQHDLELHLVHFAADSSKLVYAVFFDVSENQENSFLQSLFAQALPAVPQTQAVPRRLVLPKLFCENLEPVYVYAGSLTTAPYSEDVTWCVSSRVRTVSASQLARFRVSVPSDNNRDLQDLSGREVSRSVCAVHAQLDGKADFELDVVPVKGMLDFSNSSHNITVKVPPGNTVAHENKQYELVELHFHSPSEHTLNGVHHDLELHLVHQAEDSSKLVFAVFFHADAREDGFLKALFKSRLPKQHHSHLETRNVDLPKLFCKDKEPIFTYAGSLTTPPYSEDVTWCVSSRVRPASASQLSRFRSSVPLDNNREIQKLKEKQTKVIVAAEAAVAAAADRVATNLERVERAETRLRAELEDIYVIHKQVAQVLEQAKRIRNESLQVEAFLDDFIERKSRLREQAAIDAASLAQQGRPKAAEKQPRPGPSLGQLALDMGQNDRARLEDFLRDEESEDSDDSDDSADSDEDSEDSDDLKSDGNDREAEPLDMK
ncbi:Carbonic anhydrase [Hondaea fermentalgiana]|uniref:Carbonic anhydrase n=1 Tax=Hondaea fermentalgiana TaxID=2315210 RepID=A0A2R5GWB7_9STRA|nr:Carbonic anhydrase [Hondaea fermentalgiana]|eukprot:GBG32234.1 Carbonic anhydrase [Hondaea fermentalgiana]